MVTSSPKGKSLVALAEFLKARGQACKKKTARMAEQIVAKLSKIIAASLVYKLPSAKMGTIWRQFHQLRFDHQIGSVWQTYLDEADIPSHLAEARKILLQLILDRMLKHLISVEASRRKLKQAPLPDCGPVLDLREQNVIRYMSGYVVKQLSKKHRSGGEAAEAKEAVLSKMKADHDYICDTPKFQEYTREWVELIDREGLTHVTNETFLLMELIEKETRYCLNHLHSGQLQLTKTISENEKILAQWDEMASPLIEPHYSLELLKEVVSLWVTVRCYAFAKNVSQQESQKKFVKHGTRKTLMKAED